ncbi:monovalent cation/H+ antiporter subunit D [Lysobacter sp. N42]|uniref:monovalent cation/H+ antiporter subunit D n=1 Tax=Lysobacter sp. N42 TaxID=2545719 RepID=UPI0010449DED|nr:monovalent cation/H+ antiporter subunit D [Lysobacter sp. N42]TCZ83997.1 monovalent cation/H+ antiporter subunit D [Lysobacter sp. N42]
MSAHLPLLAIVVPLVMGAAALMAERRGLAASRLVGVLGMAMLLWIAAALVHRAGNGAIDVYLVGDWPARLGIALVADRLGALMVLATALLASGCLLHAMGGWDRRALHFHALFQLQLAGLNGAFLTGDLFNLFVFFEVMLITSYGLLLSGGRGPRMRAGLHYVVFNVTASTLFLVALGLLYGLLGTLNMAEMALRVSELDAARVPLVRAASGVLLVVFCGKAALLPLYLWLPGTYARAPASIAALFAIMTKVGVYAVLRVYTLVFGTGALAGWAWDWLLPAGLATLVLATLGALAASTLRMQVAYLVVNSAATLFIAFALATPESVGAGLFYLVHSTFIAAALFLVMDLVRQQRAEGEMLDVAAPLRHAGLLGLLFGVAAVSVVGLPPLSGFVGKLMILAATPGALRGWVWGAILATSLVALVALARTASQVFWRAAPWPATTPHPAAPDRLQLGGTVVLLVASIGLVVAGQPVAAYAQAAAEQLLRPDDYIRASHAARPALREPSP